MLNETNNQFRHLWYQYYHHPPHNYPTLAEFRARWNLYHPTLVILYSLVQIHSVTGPPWKRRPIRFAPLVLSGVIWTDLRRIKQERKLRNFNRAMFAICLILGVTFWIIGVGQ